MISDTILFSFTLIDTGAVLFLLIYFVLILSDLECDYINAQQCCSRLNFWTIPKISAHVVVTLLLLITGHYWLLLVNLPFVGYLIYEYWTVPRGNMGIFDPAEIHNRGQIKKHMSSCMIFLGFYLIIFFIYLYNMIRALLRDDPIKRIDDDEIITDSLDL
ncbi:CLUMA_CG007139, isoform A [Clunio marinus]|uniref:CLUMA_CG007139, isoform A n=1 Tax=Clunio marinus TaxID=568069 RepID=A0A1J1I5F8_9DIPT|nr:CLUMA_CG007139, isoform A [Clunio marinus]